MRFLLAALAVAFCCIAQSEETQFSSQRAKRIQVAYEASLERETKEYQAELRKLRAAYSADLEAALKASTRAGDFEEALRIRAEKKRIDEILSTKLTGKDQAAIKRLTSRAWHRFSPGEPILSVKFLPNGTVKTLNRSTSFKSWSFRDGILTLKSKTGTGGIDFVAVHDDVFAAPKGTIYSRHVWFSPSK